MSKSLKSWTFLEEERYIQFIEQDIQKDIPIQCVTGGTIHTGPDLSKLSNELDVFWPDNGTITCSKFTWYWIKESCDGVMYQHAEKSGSPLWIYFSPKQDGFYAAQVIINNGMPHYKVRINKGE
jgi:hypothetical protein